MIRFFLGRYVLSSFNILRWIAIWSMVYYAGSSPDVPFTNVLILTTILMGLGTWILLHEFYEDYMSILKQVRLCVTRLSDKHHICNNDRIKFINEISSICNIPHKYDYIIVNLIDRALVEKQTKVHW